MQKGPELLLEGQHSVTLKEPCVWFVLAFCLNQAKIETRQGSEPVVLVTHQLVGDSVVADPVSAHVALHLVLGPAVLDQVQRFIQLNLVVL